MKIVFLQTGRTTEKYIVEGVEIFSTRIKKYSGFEIITVPDIKNTRNTSGSEQKIREGKKILQLIRKDDYIILLDERGREFNSFEFAAWFEKCLMLPGKRIVFITGGPWGFSDEVYAAADFMLALSRLTLPHQMVRLLFLEQLYRAFTIMRGESYHHE